jgi:hypothetical protein
MMSKLDALLDPTQKNLLAGLDTPARIQAFLNTIPYSEDKFYRCPLRVLHDRKAHCFDGALFAAMALRRLGYPALLMELIPNGRDDDHLLALFKQHGSWGAIAQSNFSGIRFREPIHRDLHELAMSYFEFFFNSLGEKTLLAYRTPINLKVFDALDWETSDANLETLSDAIDHYRVHPLITPVMAAGLSPVDERSLHAGLLGSNPEGLFKPS